ncbi:hypothetical protein Lesp02_70730 [Lentzea sp. NBRC 105346]|uniref:hypothetical protein n=1 Tax=Lentzea sp. NBRC 105346 TaxID=3032205 RepID=UPI0024A15CB8|nr:hypothetical protein [Lentzea sp. NBRC 105346]GLZ34886.1 hypothetical protein Lesp02_70730 [Lentzea sp. NBRC 105346]
MARTAVPYSSFVGNGNLADPAGTNGDPTNGHTIAAAKPERTMLRVNNTSGASKNVTIKAGTYPPAWAAGQGDLVVAVGATSTQWIGPLESGRFLQSDGSLSIDLGASFTGTVTAFLAPKAV